MAAKKDPAAKRRPTERDGDISWQAQKSAMTRDRILDAAINCFIELGYTNVTTAKVAQSAGVSRGAMLHHFPSKTELIQAAVEYLHDKLLEDYTRRIGEIRVNVSPAYRGKGLGRVLISRIFDVGRGLGLAKLVAHMTADQHGAQAAFRRLGFIPEAVLADYVEDRGGRLRDMVIMTYDIEGHTDRMPEPLKV